MSNHAVVSGNTCEVLHAAVKRRGKLCKMLNHTLLLTGNVKWRGVNTQRIRTELDLEVWRGVSQRNVRRGPRQQHNSYSIC